MTSSNVLGPIKRLHEEKSLRAAITAMLPKGVSFEEVYAETLHAVSKNPQIEECTVSSVIRAVGLAAKTGLIIGETVHLVPYKVNFKVGNEWFAELRLEKINDYKGDIELVQRSGAARLVWAKCVWQTEEDQGRFQYFEGSVPRIEHQPIKDPQKRGVLFGAYAAAMVSPNLPPLLQWMHLSEIEVIRANSPGWKDTDKRKGCPPWYAKKTAVKQLVKFLSRNSRVAHAMLQDGILDDENRIAIVEPGEEVQVLGPGAAQPIPDDEAERIEGQRVERSREVLNNRKGELSFPGEADDLEEDRRLAAEESRSTRARR